ncbi:MAG: PKD domain-containing protein [Dehalococcoidia bacterium]
MKARRSKAKIVVALLAILLVVGLACGEDETPTPTRPTATSPPAPTSTPVPQPTPTPEPVENNPPTADFTWDPPEVPQGDNYTTIFTFTATASDPDGDPLTYEWRFTGGRPSTATGPVVTTTFPGRAPYAVTLTVSDGRGGEVTVSNTVPLGPAAPVATPTPTVEAETGETAVIDLGELNASGQTGTATLTAMGGQTEVVIDATPGISGIQHIHLGSCENLGGVAHDLGTIGADGKSVTLVDAGLDSLMSGDFAINLHDKDNPAIYTSCGDIGVVGETTQSNGNGAGPY